MPTVLRVRGYKFFFYSHEGFEPPHIHIRKGDGVAKFWLSPVRMVYSEGFKKQEVRTIIELIEKNEFQLLRVWNEIE